MRLSVVAKAACVVVALGAIVVAAFSDAVWSPMSEAPEVQPPPEKTLEEAGLNEPRAASQHIVISPPNYWDTGADDVEP